MDDPLDDVTGPDIDHILGLEGAAAATVTGAYDQGGWVITQGPQIDPYVALMATQHEANHAALNVSTAWGSVLLTIHAVAGADHDAELRSMLGPLVRRCRPVHEMYATHCSVHGITDRDDEVSAESLLQHYPRYAQYLAAARRLGPDPEVGSHWSRLAVSSVLAACMQSPALQRLAEVGVRRFFPAGDVLVNSDSPNVRLTVLRDAAPQMWAELTRMLREAMGSAWMELVAVPAGRPDLVDSVGDQVWQPLERLAYDAAVATLVELGFPCLTIEAVAEITRQLHTALAPKYPQIRMFDPEITQEVANYSADDPFRAASMLFAAETLALHPPLPATVARLTDVPDLDRLVSDRSPRRHVYLAARTVQRWRQQFTFDDTALTDLPPHSPLVAVQVPTFDGSTLVGVDLYVVDDPTQLTTLAEADTDLGLVSNTSMTCASDPSWRGSWVPALARAGRSTLLFDSPLVHGVRELLRHGGQLQFAMFAIGEGEDLLQRPIVLLFRLKDDPLLLAPCGFTAGLMMQHWVHAETGRTVGSDAGVLGDDADIVPSLIEHLTHEESLVGFW